MKTSLSDYWYPRYPSRWKRKTMHLCPYQDGLYGRLCDYYMETKEPLPDDDAALARICGISPQDFAPHADTIRAFFKLKNGRLHNKTCDEVLAFQMGSHSRRIENASKAAKKRWEKEKEKQEDTCATHSSRNANPMRKDATEHNRTEHNRTEHKKDTIVSSPLPPKGEPPGFDEFWEIYPRQRRGSKDKARAAYLKALTRTTKEEIYDGTAKYAASDEVARGYAKGAAAWLNDDRWGHDYGTQPRQHQNQKASYLDKLRLAGERALDQIKADAEADRDAPWNRE